MTTKAAEKIIEGLTQVMEGYQELQSAVEDEYSEAAEDSDEDETRSGEIDVAIVTELRGVLESVIDGEDYSTEEIAAAVSSLTSALEDLDPDVFDSDEETEDDEEESEEYYDDDDDLDFDDDDLDDEDEDEEEDDDDDEY